MEFSRRLPQEAEGKRFSVIAPEYGLHRIIREVLEYFAVIGPDSSPMASLSTHLDLTVMWEWSRLQLRLLVTQGDLVQHPQHPTVYLIGGAVGVLLDETGRETDTHVQVAGFLTTEPETAGTPAGLLTIQSLSSDIGSEAS